MPFKGLKGCLCKTLSAEYANLLHLETQESAFKKQYSFEKTIKGTEIELCQQLWGNKGRFGSF